MAATMVCLHRASNSALAMPAINAAFMLGFA